MHFAADRRDITSHHRLRPQPDGSADGDDIAVNFSVDVRAAPNGHYVAADRLVGVHRHAAANPHDFLSPARRWGSTACRNRPAGCQRLAAPGSTGVAGGVSPSGQGPACRGCQVRQLKDELGVVAETLAQFGRR